MQVPSLLFTLPSYDLNSKYRGWRNTSGTWNTPEIYLVSDITNIPLLNLLPE